MRRRGWLAALLGLVVLGSVALLAWWRMSASEPSAVRVEADNDVAADTPAQPPSARDRSTRAATKPDEAEQARRVALREQILAAKRAREAEAAKHVEPPELPDSARGSGKGLTKHVEGYDQLLDELNKDFLPLSDECIANALERAPELRGLLAINFELVVDEDLGAVIEHADIGPNNEVLDSELQECVRESLLSMVLSPGAADGSAALAITLAVEPE